MQGEGGYIRPNFCTVIADVILTPSEIKEEKSLFGMDYSMIVKYAELLGRLDSDLVAPHKEVQHSRERR